MKAQHPSTPAAALSLLALLLSLLLPGFTGCDSRTAESPGSTLPPETWFDLALGEQTIRVQLALTDDERSRGLMHREHLGENEGMLFLFSQPQRQSFWMHNTPLPLSIGYFTPDGILREIYPMYPRDRNAVTSRRRDIQYCLEMNQGWFSQKGVHTGSALNLEALRQAVEARGHSPSRFGL